MNARTRTKATHTHTHLLPAHWIVVVTVWMGNFVLRSSSVSSIRRSAASTSAPCGWATSRVSEDGSHNRWYSCAYPCACISVHSIRTAHNSKTPLQNRGHSCLRAPYMPHAHSTRTAARCSTTSAQTHLWGRQGFCGDEDLEAVLVGVDVGDGEMVSDKEEVVGSQMIVGQ